MKFKIDRIKQLVKKEVMNTIATGIVNDPRVPIVMTITRITVSKDIHYCHIYITCYGNDSAKKRAIEGLNSCSGLFQQQIARNLKLRFTPVIEFRYDEQSEKALEVDRIIYEVSKEFKDTESDKTELENSTNDEE